ncbi:MAG: hypothetical protein Q8900_07255 [Bacillota bacterium]|nr:hypothetical protein [Bacillota bacterium]
MKYIGPFLRMSKLNKDNVEKQLFHFSKEALNHILLYSRCGITSSAEELNIPNKDNTTFKSISPLLCIYRKATPKLLRPTCQSSWDSERIKREINVGSNALMTLCTTNLYSYYDKLKDLDKDKQFLSSLYRSLSKKQLDFYVSHLRNDDGVFIDKKDISDKKNTSEKRKDDCKFEQKSKKFNFSDQALFMTAFYKFSLHETSDEGEQYKSFAFDILKMLNQYQDELYNVSVEELNKICLSLNILYSDSKNDSVLPLLINLAELLSDYYINSGFDDARKSVENICLLYINSLLTHKNTDLLKYKDLSEEIYKKLFNMYNSEHGIFIKDEDKKELKFNSAEVVLYDLCMLLHSKLSEKSTSDDDMIIVDVFKHQIVDSGLILSWPEAPNLDNPERYRNYSSKSEDLLDEQDFKLSSTPTPESSEYAPILGKEIVYNKRKGEFTEIKDTFESHDNMLIYFLITYLL